MTEPAYILGHSERELSRLRKQARQLEPVTRRFLEQAGIGSGMRVLDVGSGAGDVALLAAELVGASGEVIGIDRAKAAVTAAALAARNRGLRNVTFRVGDASEMAFDRSFDAAIGRYVLLFQRDPARTLRKIMHNVRSGGVVLFHEPDWVSARSSPSSPLYDRCIAWIGAAFRRSNIEANMADKLYVAFSGAGFANTSMSMQTLICGGTACMEFLQAVSELVARLLPDLERLGVATASEVQVATLADRLRKEVTEKGSLIIGRSEIGAWARV